MRLPRAGATSHDDAADDRRQLGGAPKGRGELRDQP
ncbi:hypothetical protein GA0115260_105954, partial [Streptomyces sp. MnatMP-M27]